MGYAPFLPCRSMQHIGHWPVPPWSRVFILLLIEHASLSINHKIVFLSPPLVPILRSNNDPEVLWIVARRGAHGDQWPGEGRRRAGEFLWTLWRTFPQYWTGAHKHPGIWCLEGGYEDEETQEWDTKLRKVLICVSVCFIWTKWTWHLLSLGSCWHGGSRL